MEIGFFPGFIINKFHFNKDKELHGNICLSNVFFLLFVIFIKNFTNLLNQLPHICLFNKILGIPCPGCGIIRSFMAISRLDLYSALYYNPTGVLLVSLIIIQIFLRILAITKDGFDKTIIIFSKISNYCLLISLMVVWILKINTQLIKGG